MSNQSIINGQQILIDRINQQLDRLRLSPEREGLGLGMGLVATSGGRESDPDWVTIENLREARCYANTQLLLTKLCKIDRDYLIRSGSLWQALENVEYDFDCDDEGF